MLNDSQNARLYIIKCFLNFLNSKTNDFILKGGTSLMMCYNLDRFSEDIDLDSTAKRLNGFIENFCKENGYKYRIGKDTSIVERYLIKYNENENPLKIEVSHRKQRILDSEKNMINGINVYNINQIAIMKANAYSNRDKIRDLYDICFIVNNYWDDLDENVKSVIRTALEYKGLDECDYIIKDQKDELIDNDKLVEIFLKAYDKVGLITDNENN